MICCGTAECMAKSPRVSKLLDPDIVQVMLAARELDELDHSVNKPANCR